MIWEKTVVLCKRSKVPTLKWYDYDDEMCQADGGACVDSLRDLSYQEAAPDRDLRMLVINLDA